MIGEPLSAPKQKTDYLRLTVDDILKNYNLICNHLRKENNAFVLAEGEETVGSLRENSTHVAAAGGKLYGYDPVAKKLYPQDTLMTYNNIPPSFVLVGFWEITANKREVYCITDPYIYRLDSYNLANLGVKNGGPCGAYFRERIFTAKNYRLFYSQAFYGESWKEGRHKSGYIDLDSNDAGIILGMQPYKDKLYLFREHGITMLRVLGDDLNFKAVDMRVKYGRYIPNSVAICGENIGFFTDRGLLLFNGATSEYAENTLTGEIDFTKPVKAVSSDGVYYALVYLKSGSMQLFCYDPVQKEAHFVINGAEDIAACDNVLYYTRNGTAYKITTKGNPLGLFPTLTIKKVAFDLKGEKTLRSLAIEGAGKFFVDVSTNRGMRSVHIDANEAIKLRSPLRGNGFLIRIRMEPDNAETARIVAIRLKFTEENNDD